MLWSQIQCEHRSWPRAEKPTSSRCGGEAIYLGAGVLHGRLGMALVPGRAEGAGLETRALFNSLHFGLNLIFLEYLGNNLDSFSRINDKLSF